MKQIDGTINEESIILQSFSLREQITNNPEVTVQ